MRKKTLAMGVFRYPTAAVLCLISVMLTSQEAGLRRPSVKYRQINTDTIRIIYPAGLEPAAQRIAHLTTTMARQRPFSTGAPLRKIDILLQNATDIPNGYVGLGPWRSEFYLTPPQNSFDIGSLPWHEVLAIHEFRHVQQLSAARKGISSLLYYVFGEEAFSGAVHLVAPDWFIEGDAVIAETVLTPQGRGRLPAFTNAFREMVSDSVYWKYDKVRNGSLKEFIPSEYPLGYLLVNYGREKYDQQFWDSIFVASAAYRGLFYPFSAALRQRTGMSSKAFYRNAMDFYRALWDDPNFPTGQNIPGKRFRYRDHSYPVISEDGSLYVMVDQFDRIPAIYKVQNDHRERVVSPGFQTEPVFSFGGGKICWTELRRHPRWSREDHSVIVVFDPVKKTRQSLTRNSSYFMPALSPDGSQIVSVFDNDFQTYALHLLSAETGEVNHTIPNPGRYFYTHPQWSPDGRSIISAARLPDGRMTLVEHNIPDESIIELIDPVQAPIGRPCVTDAYVYFTMSHGETDQIYRVHRDGRTFEQVTFDPVSKYQPVIDPRSEELVYTQFSLSGKVLKRMDVSRFNIRTVPGDVRMKDPSIHRSEKNILATDDHTEFQTSTYSLLARPIRLHSWSMYSDDPLYGVELLSENTLNTIQWRSGWEYNRNSGYHGPFTELTFGLWYPQIVAGYSATRIDRIVQNRELVWWQHVINAGLRIPYSAYRGHYTQSGSVSTRFNHISTTGDADFRFDYLSHTVHFTNGLMRAQQHPESRFSQNIIGRILHSVDTTTAKQFYAGAEFNFPSPVRNHLFKFELDYKHELTKNTLRFSDVFEYARGYEPIESDDIWRLGLSYQLPLVYPDFGIAGLIYFRRIRLAPFFDIMRTAGVNYRSAGGELYFDVRVFNVEPTSFGFRWARRLDGDEGDEFSFIIPTGL